MNWIDQTIQIFGSDKNSNKNSELPEIKNRISLANTCQYGTRSSFQTYWHIWVKL